MRSRFKENNPVGTSQPGYLAQLSGKDAELWVEASLRQYKLDGLAFGQRNWPEIKQQGYRAVVVGKAGPDWTVFSQGQAIQLEVKTWQAKDRHLYSFTGTKSKRRRLPQYLTLRDAVEVGGCVGYYLVAWRHESFGTEWRLHDVMGLTESRAGLVFEREQGLLVPTSEAGWPDWLPV